MSRTTKGLWSIVACATLWSMGGLFIKMVQWHPMIIAGGRGLVAALFMLAIRLFRSKSVPFAVISPASRKSPGALWGAAAMNAATMLIFVAANKLTTAANVILLQYSAPIYAALFGWALAREKPKTEHWLALAALAVGLYVFFKDGISGGGFVGDMLALVSGVTFALYSVFMRMQKDGNPEDSILLSYLISAVVGLPFAFVAPPEFTATAVSGVLILGVFQIGVASLFFAYGIRRITAVQSMLAAVVEPVLNPVWVFLATGEQPAASAFAGGAIILTAVTGSSVASARRDRAVAAEAKKG
jgi:drug/metabolite transporter (DMT)-like permease